ncbi:hypothetical protein [Rodentibacter genomosp. 2]|uniref:Uncharacterized protein n=1 Tax=Rodentibacter genomosp. 2 TaxID=1908266 RepID=A0A1V3JLH5_9PAST|nr:hypothetical protein [Rodentibacter genomosp. 2]OOF57515.1 hypothetical protein BKK55_04445 [Rodentibacter genomosp. 2]
MTFSEKIGYKVGSTVAKFKNWQVASWVKITVAIGILALFAGLVYVSYMLAQFIAFVAILALVISSKNLKNIPLSNDDDHEKYDFDYSLSEGYRNGHSGDGYYDSNDIKLHD